MLGRICVEELALEQVNRAMEVMGGLEAITQRPNTLAKYFLAAHDLARLAPEAEQMTDFSQAKSSHPHDQSNTITTRHEVTIKKLSTSPFTFKNKYLIKISTKCVVPSDITKDILGNDQFGKEI